MTSTTSPDVPDGRAPFRTRARAVDHLGRGQIADAPTAVSELWKNAYDAYARNVSLDLFEGGDSPPAAAVFDDGHGMSAEDFRNRWLVIGTEAKVTGKPTDSADRFGLPERPRQGEKGIGRLSAAFLAPVTLVVSKRRGGPFVAALLDWRMFENPLLDLSDVYVAVEAFEEFASLFDVLPRMADAVRENVTGAAGPPSRTKRMQNAWTEFSAIERANSDDPTTAERILATPHALWIQPEAFNDWPIWLHDDPHGTALLMFDLADLRAIVDPANADPAEAADVQTELLLTLKNYTDPFSTHKSDFDYEVNIRRIDGSRRALLVSTKGIGPDDFSEFEHWVDGSFDERGIFAGRIRAFGGEPQDVLFTPSRLIPINGLGRPGPFGISVCTIEQVEKNSSHVPEVYAHLDRLIEDYGGMNVFRDGLRVLPYGRPNSDLFGIEERRGKHAGREFWAYRRLFGRVTITREENPQLKDKAGREGLVDNAARRAFRRLVVDLLIDLARRYYGTDSADRAAKLNATRAKRRLGEEAALENRKKRRREFRTFLRTKRDAVEAALTEAERVRVQLRAVADLLRSADSEAAASAMGAVAGLLDPLLVQQDELRPPLPPGGLSNEDEEAYRSYRDIYGSLANELEAVREAYNEAEAVSAASPQELVEERFNQLAERLDDTLSAYSRTLSNGLSRLGSSWESSVRDDLLLFRRRAGDILASDLEAGQLVGALNALDGRYRELSEELAAAYDARIDSLDRLSGGVALSAALSVVDDDRVELERLVRDLESVAQLGITVEIIGHELEELDHEVGVNLNKVRADIGSHPALDRAYEAHRALTDRLRFLSPLQLAGYRERQEIRGDAIAAFVVDFFGRRFERAGVRFTATDSFRRLLVSDLPSRIFPVFVNLINNALYWAGRSEDREVRLDYINGKVVVADTGVGVDPDDVERLFTLFFSRRPSGRGVGLYLVKANLAAANHRIRYAGPEDPRVLPGANFIIEFRGVHTK